MDAARKTKLGDRWTCFSCAAKFYDLHKPQPVCPKCGSNQHESPQFKQKKTKKVSAPKKVATAPRKPAPEPEEQEMRIDEDIEPTELIEADSGSEELDLEDLDMGEEEDLSAVEVVEED